MNNVTHAPEQLRHVLGAPEKGATGVVGAGAGTGATGAIGDGTIKVSSFFREVTCE